MTQPKLEKLTLRRRKGTIPKAAKKMRTDWDRRAAIDAMYYICPQTEQWNIEQFFESGARKCQILMERYLQELIPETRDKRMLEIGCGLGRMARHFSRIFAEVWGSDVSNTMIKRARELNSDLRNVRFVLGSGYDLRGTPSQYFDFVFSYLVFQYIPEKWMTLQYFRETFRVLREGGVFQIHLRGYGHQKPFWKLLWRLYNTSTRAGRPLFPTLVRSLFCHFSVALSRRLSSMTDSLTWLGTSIEETDGKRFLESIGFRDVRAFPDKTEPRDSGNYWVTGRKATSMKEGNGSEHRWNDQA